MGYFPLCLLSTHKYKTELELMTSNVMPHTTTKLLKFKLMELVDDGLAHDGFSDIRIEVKILKRGQKEVILHYGKQYRFVVDMHEINEATTTKQVSG